MSAMEQYKNLSRKSGVRAYEIGDDFIIVEFLDGSQYLYNNQRPGSSAVEKMKELAHGGIGLNTFINQVVKKNYASKLR